MSEALEHIEISSLVRSTGYFAILPIGAGIPDEEDNYVQLATLIARGLLFDFLLDLVAKCRGIESQPSLPDLLDRSLDDALTQQRQAFMLQFVQSDSEGVLHFRFEGFAVDATVTVEIIERGSGTAKVGFKVAIRGSLLSIAESVIAGLLVIHLTTGVPANDIRQKGVFVCSINQFVEGDAQEILREAIDELVSERGAVATEAQIKARQLCLYRAGYYVSRIDGIRGPVMIAAEKLYTRKTGAVLNWESRPSVRVLLSKSVRGI